MDPSSESSKTNMSSNTEKGEDEFTIIDLSQRSWIGRALGDVKKGSVAKQITVGGVSGWCSGYVFAKVGKAAAAAIGGGLLLIQVANYQGYVCINWGKIKQSVTQTKKTIKTDVEKVAPAILQESVQFIRSNMWMTGGFVGGFLLGLSS